MATEKKMDETSFGSIVKEITAFGELIRTHQDEKQYAMNEFDKERERYRAGKISRKALSSSVAKINKELKKLDKTIRRDISNLVRTANQAKKFAMRQAPRPFRVTISRIKSRSRK